ncbi:MAG: hypothetical protein E7588_06940 [Ruminococcaceae bacterium]|nr:hypothetical protein [Oscillospiraceae bacterium]
MKGFQRKTRKYKKGIIHSVLSAIVLAVMVARFVRADYYAVFLCVLTLVLFYIPVIVDRTFNVSLPKELEAIILLFVFAAEILGEIGSFYTHIPWWDTMLHTVNGFLMAAIGFAMIDILNNSPRFHFNLSPVFVAFVAFCFSMTVGVAWEFFEFGMDCFTAGDMQKDRIIDTVSSVLLNPDGVNAPVILNDVTSTVIHYGENRTYTVNGYLDIGIADTMKDLIVNCIGAVVFSAIGYFYIIGRNKGIFASKFIPRMKTAEEIEHQKTKQLQTNETSQTQKKE